MAKEAGITGILLEWEDTFPWRNELANVTLTQGGYSRDEVEDLVYFIESHGLDLIPLIQTFGHVEFILKGSQYRHLRETEEDPQSFSPSNAQTPRLIEEMILQVRQEN